MLVYPKNIFIHVFPILHIGIYRQRDIYFRAKNGSKVTDEYFFENGLYLQICLVMYDSTCTVRKFINSRIGCKEVQ